MHPQQALSSEERLLLLLARGRLTESIQTDVRALLEQPLSWPLLLKQAWRHGVTPLLYRHLQELGFPGIPATAVAELRDAYGINSLRNRFMVRELAQVLQRLGSAGVPVIPLKGAALAASLYGDPTLRVSADIDILVPRASVGQAYQLLQAMGYRGKSPELMEGPRQRYLLNTHIEYQLVRAEGKYQHLLELHWGIFLGARSERRALTALWAEAHSTPVFGVMAFQPSIEWTFLFLALHAAKHTWQGLKWLSDIHELCTWTPMDWAKIRYHARRGGWKDVVDLTLGVCHTLFDTPIPPHFSQRPLPSWVHLFPADQPPLQGWGDILSRSRLFRSPIDYGYHLMRLLLVPTETERQLIRLPATLSVLYYPLRPLRLAWRFAGICLRTLRGGPGRDTP